MNVVIRFLPEIRALDVARGVSFIALVGFALLAQGCCGATNQIQITHWDNLEGTSLMVQWDDPSTLHTMDRLVVTYLDPGSVVSEPLELYGPEGRVQFAGENDARPQFVGTCSVQRYVYRLENVDPGRYTLVHRPSSFEGSEYAPELDAQWSEHNGEQALVKTVTVRSSEERSPPSLSARDRFASDAEELSPRQHGR